MASGAPPPDERGAPHDPEREPAPGRGLDRFVRPFFTDATLWPVTFAAIAILVTFVSAIALFALSERNPFALAALAVIVVASLDAVWRDLRRRTLGPVGAAILGLWGLVALVCVAARWLGVF